MIDDPEEFAWQQLEKKQQQQQHKKPTPATEREALKIALNALIEIDKEAPYPLAKHAAMVINTVLSVPATDWEAVAADQALIIATLRQDVLDEREACAKLCDEEVYWDGDLATTCAAAIRGRAE